MSPIARRAAPVVALLLLTLRVPTLEAQDCGSWNQPVLCTIDLQMSVDRARSQRFDPNRRLEIAPRQQIEIELSGRDQFGRDFPSDRLSFGVDDRDCGQLLDVEDRGRGILRLGAGSSTGQCRLDLWVPGNLNFEWRVEIEVSAGARSGYSRGEAEFLARALYLAILGREIDAGSLGGATAELEQGHLEAQISSMLRSGEFRQSLSGVAPEQLLDRFYQGLLGREADAGGIRTYLNDLQRGAHEEVLLKIIQSGEFEQRLAREAR